MRPARFAPVLFLPLALALVPGEARADRLPDRAQRVVDYQIAVRLDAVKKQLEGRERVTWTNPSGEEVGDLWLHLYLNAFKNTSSTFIRESGGQLRGDRMSDAAEKGSSKSGAPAQPGQPTVKQKHLFRCEVRIEIGCLRQKPNLLTDAHLGGWSPQQLHFPLCRLREPEKHFHGRGFAGSIRP